MEIIQDFISSGRINRPGTANLCRYITIHDTANKDVGADAAAHAKYIKNLNNRTSWHYSVDDHSIYQHIPDTEKSYHTSRADANESSIAIEMCVNEDGSFEKTLENAIWLVRVLMERHNIPAENIRTHREWTGKNCPAALDEAKWENFLGECAKRDEKFITIDELSAMGYCGIKW